MDNSTLNSRAKELEQILAPKLKCYCKVGWLRDGDVGEVFTVYVDKRARVSAELIPSTWYGLPVSAQDVLPPGIIPPDSDTIPHGIFP